MSPLNQKIESDLKGALKSGDNFKLGVLRLLSSALHNRSIEKKGKGLDPVLNDEEVLEVLAKEAKKRKEAATIYEQGGRADLAQKENEEWEIIKDYLPEEAPAEEIDKVISDTISRLGGNSAKDFGRVMAEVMKQLKGRADAGAVSQSVRKKLG